MIGRTCQRRVPPQRRSLAPSPCAVLNGKLGSASVKISKPIPHPTRLWLLDPPFRWRSRHDQLDPIKGDPQGQRMKD